MAIKLGSKVRDTLTGFAGIATARCEYLYGCVRIEISPTEIKDGKLLDSVFLDEQRVEVVREEAPKVSPDSSATAGGPQNDPPRSA